GSFDASSQTGSLTVMVAHLSVSADPKSKTYGETNPALTYTIGGFVNGEGTSVVSGSASLTTTADRYSDVVAGSYAISVDVSGLRATNYDFTPVNGTLTIDKANQTISWSDPAAITYGTALESAQF